MTLQFRNVEGSPHDAVQAWPVEAIQAALERGSLTHWRRLAEAIRTDPWGPTSRRVEAVLRYSRPYGVAELMEALIVAARAEAEATERKQVAEEIRDLVAASGLSRAEFAARVGTSASRLSTYLTGKVTPSAALMVRFARVGSGRHSARLARHSGPDEGLIPGPRPHTGDPGPD